MSRLQIEEELWEEEFIERCFQEMLEEEEEHEWFIPARDLPQTMDQIQDQFNDLVISDSSSLEDLVVSLSFSKLNVMSNQALLFKKNPLLSSRQVFWIKPQ